MAQDSRPCKGCGEPILRNAPVAPIRHYCSPDCRPRCEVADCVAPQASKDMCAAHSRRAARHGDPLTPLKRHKNVGDCEVPGCDRPMRSRRMCAGHSAQHSRYGEAKPFAYTWADEPMCLICDNPNGGFRSRKFCSAKCMAIWHRHKGVPENPTCARCATEIDLTVLTKAGQRKRADTKLCNRCKSQSRTEATPGELALRDGPYCQLCGCDVDLLAVFPDKMRPSVDHIIPRAWGGSDAASNNQLTHLLCNQTKSDRREGVSSRSIGLDRPEGR